jgi:hypothetical protein
MEPFACWAIWHTYDLKNRKRRREQTHCHGRKNVLFLFYSERIVMWFKKTFEILLDDHA